MSTTAIPNPNHQTLFFATGNMRKFSEAARAAQEHSLTLQAKDLAITEIQSSIPSAVAEAKAKDAYKILRQPVLTHDSSWSIPALRGFPGAYMHDMIHWFEPADWPRLMSGCSDRSIEVCETIAFFDGHELKTVQYRRQGTFSDTARGNDGNSIEKVVILNDNQTIAEHYDAGITDNGFDLTVWHEFFSWYQTYNPEIAR